MIEHGHERRARRLAAGGIGVLSKARLHELEVPVAHLAPEEVIQALSDVVQAVALQPSGGVLRGRTNPRKHPPIFERQVALDFGEWPHRGVAQAQQHEAARIPDLVREVASVRESPLDVLVVEADVGAHRGLAHQGVAHGVCPEGVHDLERIDAVAQRLGHLASFHVADGSVQIHLGERRLTEKFVAHHDHARDPEEQDLGRCDHGMARVERLHIGGLLGPAEH